MTQTNSTNSTTNNSSNTAETGLAPDDPRAVIARAIKTAEHVVSQLDSNNAGNATPCEDWNALEVAQHIVGVLHRVTAVAEGADLMAMPLLADSALDDLSTDMAAASADITAAWSDPALLDTPMTLPFGVLPGAATLGAYASELLTHAWDIATAIGVDVNWPNQDITLLHGFMSSSIPAEIRNDDAVPFGAVVEVAASASPIEQMVAWVGRNPR